MCGNCNHSLIIPSPAQAVHGVKALSQLAFKSESRAPEEVIKARRDICRECPEATKNQKYMNRPSKGLTSLSQCKLCACIIAAKTMHKDEHCPLNPPKW